MSNLIKSTSVDIPKEVSNKNRSVYQANSSVSIKNIEDNNPSIFWRGEASNISSFKIYKVLKVTKVG